MHLRTLHVWPFPRERIARPCSCFKRAWRFSGGVVTKQICPGFSSTLDACSSSEEIRRSHVHSWRRPSSFVRRWATNGEWLMDFVYWDSSPLSKGMQLPRVRFLDRKSTRLNSSHGYI